MRRSKFICLWLCLAHAMGGWAGLRWPEPFAERVHHHFFSLTALALAEMHRADDARREDLQQRGFPAQSAGVEGNRLGEVIVACIAERKGTPYPFVFEDGDSYEQIIDRTKRRLEHAYRGFGPFGKYQVNHEEKRPMRADDVIDRIQKLPPQVRACVDRAWADHKKAFGTNLTFNPLIDDDVRPRMVKLGLSAWVRKGVRSVSMPLPLALPAPPVEPRWFDELFWLVAMVDDDTPDTRDLYGSSIAGTLWDRFMNDACAHAHLHRATCALNNEPNVTFEGPPMDGSTAAFFLNTVLSQAIAQGRVTTENFEPIEAFKFFRNWLAPDKDPAVVGPEQRYALAAMLLALEQQRCDQPDAQLDAACTQDDPFDFFDF